MTDRALTPTVSESERLYAAWRCARARWELALWDRAEINSDLPDEAESAHCSESYGALLAFLLHPAATLRELSLKLRTFHLEDGTGFSDAARIVEALANDAHELAFKEACRAHHMKLEAA